jgi:hypothetical protein
LLYWQQPKLGPAQKWVIHAGRVRYARFADEARKERAM